MLQFSDHWWFRVLKIRQHSQASGVPVTPDPYELKYEVYNRESESVYVVFLLCTNAVYQLVPRCVYLWLQSKSVDLFKFFQRNIYIYLSLTVLVLIFGVMATHVDNVGVIYIYRFH